MAAAAAAAYSCGHCAAFTRIAVARPGVALADVFHDPGCPVLRGVVDRAPAARRAVIAALAAQPARKRLRQ